MGPEAEIKYHVLRAIADSKAPLGSGALARSLMQAGFRVSEATAGRLLRNLDAEGLTERSGYRGRELTALGFEKLDELKRQIAQRGYNNSFIDSLKVNCREELLDLLVARRAVERENARLAAMNARREHLDAMREMIRRHETHLKEGIVTVDDIQFHRVVAEAGGNRVLLAATDLIRQNIELTTVLEVIRRRFRRGIVMDHKNILAAIESKNPEAAQEAMVRHLENVIVDVNAYWDETGSIVASKRDRGHG